MNILNPKVYYTAKELKNFAKERGIKYYTRMSKKELCEVLNISLVKRPNKIFIKNVGTGEEHGFNSVYRASKEMKVNPGLIFYYEGKEMKLRDVVYSVKIVK